MPEELKSGMPGARPGETAPKDGQEIFAWDGEYWRDVVYWEPKRGKRPEGFYFARIYPVKVLEWLPANHPGHTIHIEINKGYRVLPKP